MSSRKRKNIDDDRPIYPSKKAKKPKYSEERKSRFFNSKNFLKKHKNELVGEDDNLSDLQKVFQTKIQGAKFRMLNEQLYTLPSEDSEKLFKEDPSLFQDYHDGKVLFFLKI
jgi:ribosomal RNA-processing protein 8